MTPAVQKSPKICLTAQIVVMKAPASQENVIESVPRVPTPSF